MSSADKRGCTWLKVLKSEASEGDWMKSHADRMLIGWQGDAQKSHWKKQAVKMFLLMQKEREHSNTKVSTEKKMSTLRKNNGMHNILISICSASTSVTEPSSYTVHV
ncbi:hypothetical protein GOODEAATRI_018110 [Goodea atripinnis]|uniref:Uncharacterized protein n=1 Tax=Goodea atripinnis TaxID=208336 RepID=A0ABV0N4L4_9TELE